jgi:hypothetical protein
LKSDSAWLDCAPCLDGRVFTKTTGADEVSR